MTACGGFTDLDGWRDIAARFDSPGAEGAAFGFVLQSDFDANRGEMVVWTARRDGFEIGRQRYESTPAPELSLLMVLGPDALAGLREGGPDALAGLVRKGQVRPFVLQPPEALEAAGLEDFVERLGLAFPRH